ncbi:Hypothetical protein PHPALM_37592 [Phytophthora palmivora]|uniref:Uncharacterized protein n=1 Tax=Phytophthora palmivora TaxID=4796 RepID=A0A2P4WX13_9STRA|nr:Hypothetical protein PHPALM_37592 [Phytophthora palmivora]
MKRPVFRIKVADSDQQLKLMTTLLYSRTEDAYDAGYDEHKQYCKTMKKSAFFAYFEKNRDSWRAK